MIHRLDDKEIYVGNQSVNRMYLGNKLLKGKAIVGYDDKPGFDFLPSTFKVYHTDFKYPDTNKPFITSGFDESLGVYRNDGFLFTNKLRNAITFRPAKEPATNDGVMVDINVSISNLGFSGSEHLFEAKLGDTIRLNVYNNYDKERIEVVGLMTNFPSNTTFTKNIPWTTYSRQHVNLILYGTHRRANSNRGAYIEGQKLGNSYTTASPPLSSFQLTTHSNDPHNDNPLLYEVTLLNSALTGSLWDVHRNNLYKRALNYYK